MILKCSIHFRHKEIDSLLTCIVCGEWSTPMEYHSQLERVQVIEDEQVEISLQTIIDEWVEDSFKLCYNVKKIPRLKKFGPENGRYGRKPLYCGICRSSMPSVTPRHSKAALARHYLCYHSKWSHKCPLCGEQFRHSYQIGLHKMLKHKQNVKFIKFVIN